MNQPDRAPASQARTRFQRWLPVAWAALAVAQWVDFAVEATTSRLILAIGWSVLAAAAAAGALRGR